MIYRNDGYLFYLLILCIFIYLFIYLFVYLFIGDKLLTKYLHFLGVNPSECQANALFKSILFCKRKEKKYRKYDRHINACIL